MYRPDLLPTDEDRLPLRAFGHLIYWLCRGRHHLLHVCVVRITALARNFHAATWATWHEIADTLGRAGDRARAARSGACGRTDGSSAVAGVQLPRSGVPGRPSTGSIQHAPDGASGSAPERVISGTFLRVVSVRIGTPTRIWFTYTYPGPNSRPVVTITSCDS